MARKIPHHTLMFLYRQGLKLEPSQNFIDKFVENYNELLYKNKIRHHVPPLDNKTAIFFINSVVEAVVYCLDFGYDVWFRHVLLFFQKVTDYRHNIKKHSLGVIEDVKKISIRPIKSMTLRIKAFLNKDNKPYQEFLSQKKERYNEIKRYYREFYDKKSEWWQDLPD